MLPGCVLAGIGLGFTNTPVTNTTTGAVPPNAPAWRQASI
jgi:hypothetical protein